MRKRIFPALTALLAATMSAGPALGQAFPSKPIRVIVGTAPAGMTDIYARLYAANMEKALGQPLVIDNRAGANGTIAANAVVKSPADGYTLLFGGGVAVNPIFSKNNAVDQGKELAPVSMLVTGPYYVITSTKLPVTSLKELVAYAKANPNKLNYGSPAAPNFDLLMAVLKERAGVTYTTINYKGVAQIGTAMAAGEADITIGVPATFSAGVQAGTARVLFAAAPKRVALLPNVPTAAEVGLPNFEAGTYLGLWAPLGTPRDVIQKISSAAAVTAKLPEVAERASKNGDEALGTSPEECLRLFLADIKFWTEAARAANFQPQ